MYKNNDQCPICGEGLLKKKIIQETFSYKGNYRTIENYIVYECSDCGESIVDPKTLKETEKIIRDFHREVDGLLTSEEIKKIRNQLGYTQNDFSRILGGGIKSFTRYENGTVTQSKSMDNLLRIIQKYPDTLDVLTKTDQKSIKIEPIRRKTVLETGSGVGKAEIDTGEAGSGGIINFDNSDKRNNSGTSQKYKYVDAA